MATSGTYAFNLDFLDIVETAYENARLEVKTGYDLKQARRELDLLLLEWANKGVHLWTVEEATPITLTSGTVSYTVPATYLDVLDAVVRDTNGIDRTINRYTMEEYLRIPNKTSSGSVSCYTTFRTNSTITLKVWQAPSDSNSTFRYYGIRYMQDTGSYTNNPDVPRRFLPALVKGLSWRIANKKPIADTPEMEAANAAVRRELFQDYQQTFQEARDEDRERTSLFLVPHRRRW